MNTPPQQTALNRHQSVVRQGAHEMNMAPAMVRMSLRVLLRSPICQNAVPKNSDITRMKHTRTVLYSAGKQNRRRLSYPIAARCVLRRF